MVVHGTIAQPTLTQLCGARLNNITVRKVGSNTDKQHVPKGVSDVSQQWEHSHQVSGSRWSGAINSYVTHLGLGLESDLKHSVLLGGNLYARWV